MQGCLVLIALIAVVGLCLYGIICLIREFI